LTEYFLFEPSKSFVFWGLFHSFDVPFVDDGDLKISLQGQGQRKEEENIERRKN